MDSASQRTTYPSVTGGSVVAVKYNGGVLVAADTIMSYGTLAKFDGVVRMAPVGAKGQVLLSAGGDYSDYQQMLKIINSSAVEEYTMDDGAVMSASAMHHWLTRIMYQRRSKMDPLWNAVVIAGVGGDGQSYLGTTDMYGTMYADNFIVSARASPPHKERARAPLSLPHTARAPLPPTHTHAPARTRMVVAKWARERLRTRQHARVPLGRCWPSTTCSLRLPPPPSFVDLLPPPSSSAWLAHPVRRLLRARPCQATGMGAHLALPLLRKAWKADLTEAEARKVLEDCMRVCFYRSCTASNKITIGKASEGACAVSDIFSLDTFWEVSPPASRSETLLLPPLGAPPP